MMMPNYMLNKCCDYDNVKCIYKGWTLVGTGERAQCGTSAGRRAVQGSSAVRGACCTFDQAVNQGFRFSITVRQSEMPM